MPNTQFPTSSSQRASSNSPLPASDFHLRSEEIQEILTRVPHWLIRWGSVVILSILILLFTISWVVKYPDIISTEIVITTNIPPQKIMARTSGRIESILIKNNNIVTKNTPLAIIENSANYKDIFLLKSIVDTINIEKSHFPFEKLLSTQLGDIESAYTLFQKDYIAYELNYKLKPYEVEGTALSYESIQLKERLSLLESQKNDTKSEMELQKSDLNRYELLFKKGIIAEQELEKHRLIYLQTERSYKSILSSISQLKSSLNDLNKNSKTVQINKNKENVNLERNVITSFYQLKKTIKDWELNYVLRSSTEGKVSFLQLWAENQTVSAGDEVFTIIPSKESGFIGKVKAPIQNSGKLKVGQKVNIRLANYPDREFGIIAGKVKAISLTPDKNNNLLLDISLPNGMQTSYKKKIEFLQEMSGTADIVTEDLRLLERLLYQFKDIFKR